MIPSLVINSFQDEAFNESNVSEQINIDENFGRKRTNTEDHIQTFSSSGKRLRIISEPSITGINEEEDDMEDEVHQVRVTTKRNDSHNVQPKVENNLEFLEEAAHNIQQSTKQPQNITYMNMDSFTEKTNTVTNQQQQPQTTGTRKLLR